MSILARALFSVGFFPDLREALGNKVYNAKRISTSSCDRYSETSFPRFLQTSPFRKLVLQRSPYQREGPRGDHGSPLCSSFTYSLGGYGHTLFLLPNSSAHQQSGPTKFRNCYPVMLYREGTWFTVCYSKPHPLASSQLKEGEGKKGKKKIICYSFLKESHVLPCNSRHEKSRPRVRVLVNSPSPALRPS